MNENTLTPYAALILRVSLGTMFIAHALLKWFVFTLPGTVGFFTSVGFPGSLAYVVFAMELMGGIMLLAGSYTRIVSLALIPVLLGAAYVHFPNGWVFSAPNGGWEYPVFLAMVSVVMALLGDGAYSVRELIGAKPKPSLA